jgi:AcrR family transcriptional regulator
MTKEQVLDRLLETFRTKGYDGSSLAELSAATGLMKSSLYHHFPGGKQEMAAEALAHLDRQLSAHLFTPLRSKESPADKVGRMLDTIDAFYDGGRKACLFERLCASTERQGFRRPLKRAFTVWMQAIEDVCREAGVPAADAKARAEDFVIRIEGALVVCAGTGDLKVFQRTVRDLRRSLLSTAM